MSLPPRFAVLGPVVIVGDDGRPAPLRGARPRLLAAVLAARRGRVVTADELVDALWRDDPPEHPAAALQSQIHRLRRLLGSAGDAVVTVGAGYRLDGPDELVDATRFETLVARADDRASEPDVALAALDEAMGLWRGRAFLEVADHDAIRPEAVRLEELRAIAAETRAELLLDAGRTDEAAQAADDVIAEHPYRERPVAVRMRALVRRGRHVDALRAYEDLRRRLGEDLGLEPSPELRDLEGEVLRHEAPAPTIGLPGNSFVGREVDLAATVELLDRVRLLTVTGPGGVGKTRLAAHTAVRVADRFPDGVHLCELAAVTDPAAVASAVASALRVEQWGGGGLVRRVVDYLGTKRALLLLDNCEHVLDGVAELVTAVLARTPDVVVLATSRQRIGVEGEHVFPLRPLPAPEAGAPGPAVSLFLDRAAAVGPGAAPSAEDSAVLAELCIRLDGLPLAIELAAARTVSRPLDEILAEITARLDQLDDTRRRVDRHRSIEAAVGWSYDLLAPSERDLFARLSVFAGGWTPEAAEQVAGRDGPDGFDGAAALGTLVEHSLVTTDPLAGRIRFSMLEPIRQYAESRLRAAGQLDATHSRHAAWAAGWLATADAGLRGPDEARWRSAIEVELANLRAAHRWAIANDIEAAVAIVARLSWYAYFHGPSEVFDWADETIGRIAEDDTAGRERSRAHATAAIGAWRWGDLARARTLAERGVARAPAGDPVARFSWDTLRSAESLSGRYEMALVARDRVVALDREAGDTVLEAQGRIAGALSLGYLGAVDAAIGELGQATALLDMTDNPSVRAFADYVAGEIRIDVDPAEAIPLLLRSRDRSRAVGNRFVAGIAGASAVSAAARTGDPAAVIDEYAELIEHFHRTGAWVQLWTTIRALIETMARLGRREPAAVLYGALSSSAAGLPGFGPDATRLAGIAAELLAHLGDVEFERLTAEGAAFGDERAVAYALDAVVTTPRRV